MRRTLALFALLVAAPALAGCSSAVSADEVAEQVSNEIEAQIGEDPGDLTCPEDLPAEVDAEIVCLLAVGEDTADVTVTVTSVEDGTANFDFKVADEVN